MDGQDGSYPQQWLCKGWSNSHGRENDRRHTRTSLSDNYINESCIDYALTFLFVQGEVRIVVVVCVCCCCRLESLFPGPFVACVCVVLVDHFVLTHPPSHNPRSLDRFLEEGATPTKGTAFLRKDAFCRNHSAIGLYNL